MVDAGTLKRGRSAHRGIPRGLSDGEPLLRARLSIRLAGIAYTYFPGAHAFETATRALAHARVSRDGPVIAAALNEYAYTVIRHQKSDGN